MTLFCFIRKPTHENEPVSGFKPIENDDLHFLDINNDGLTTDLNPHQNVVGFWLNIEQQARFIQNAQQKCEEL